MAIRRDWEQELEVHASVTAGRSLDVAAVRDHDRSGNRQTEPEAAAAGVEERVEDVLEVLLVDSAPRVAHRQFNLAVQPSSNDRQQPRAIGLTQGLDSVGNQIVKGLLELDGSPRSM